MLQAPEHNSAPSPGVEPYRPRAQADAFATTDPAMHQYPNAHCPEHAGVPRPVTPPNVPAGHPLLVDDVEAAGQ